MAVVFGLAAACLYIARDASEIRQGYQRPPWTFASVAYAVHACYSATVSFSDSLSAVFSDQSARVGVARIVVGAIWGADVVLSWTAVPGDGPKRALMAVAITLSGWRSSWDRRSQGRI